MSCIPFNRQYRTPFKRTIAIVIVFLLLIATIGCQNNEGRHKEGVIKLKYSSAYLPNDLPNLLANHTLDLVEEKTNGRVEIERYMGGALGDSFEQLDLVSSGAVDIIDLHVDQYPQQLPLHKILNAEQFVDSDQALANVFAITQEIPETMRYLDAEAQENNIKILFWAIGGSTGITAGFPAKSMDDLKDKKINVITSYQRNVFGECGIIPVNVQIPELYEALSRGVIDAIFMSTLGVVSNKWYEVGKTQLELGINVVVSNPITLNLNRWNSLPKDIQQAFMEAAEETSKWSIELDRQLTKNTYDICKRSNVDIVNLSNEECRDFFEALSRYVSEDSLQNATNRGVGDQAAVLLKYWNTMKWGKQAGN